MLGTYGLVAKIIKEAWNSDHWEPAGFHASRQGAAEYWAHETVHRIGEPYCRLILARSSSMDLRKEKSMMKRVEKARAAIAKEAKRFVVRHLVCKADARRAPSSS